MAPLRHSNPKLLSWVLALVVGCLLSIIGYLIAESRNDVKAVIQTIAAQVNQQATDFARLDQRVMTLEGCPNDR